jgi:hypothetical protein
VRIFGGLSRAWQGLKRVENEIIVEADPWFYGASVAAATAAATRATGRHWRGCGGRSAIPVSVGRAEYRELNGIFLSRALRAGNFLVLVQDNSFERRFTIVANVFVNWHQKFPI